MALVLLALGPGIAAHMWFFGPGILIQIGIASAVALALEAAMLHLRQRPLRPFLTDLSAPLTAVLFALSVPPLAPWWVAAVRPEEHTSELQSLMSISYAVFCLKIKKPHQYV